jgi:hypothetical protein
MRTNGHLFFLFPLLESHNSDRADPRTRAAFVSQTMPITIAAICLSAFAFGFVGPKVSAQTIVPVSQARSISAFSATASSSTNPSSSAADFGPFNSQILLADGSANQTSAVNAASITVSGAAHGDFFPPNTGSGSSDFSVTFNLVSSCLFTLSGSMLTIFDQSFPTAPTVDLSSTNGTVFHLAGGASTFNNQVPTNFSTNGVLASGQYTLSAHAVGQGDHFGNENYNVNFSVTPVPEPATMTLLILGGAALIGLRRSRLSIPR